MAAIKLHDRVLQTTLAGGVGNIIVGAARVNSYRALRDVPEILAGDTWFYCIEDEELDAFEIGKGHYDTVEDELVRDVVLTSSNSNFPVNAVRYGTLR